MNKYLFTLIMLMAVIGSFAQFDKKTERAMETATKNLKSTVIPYLKNEAAKLDDEIKERESLRDKYSRRSFVSSNDNEVSLEQLLSGYRTLEDLYKAQSKVSKVLNNAKESDIRNTYSLILDMMASLSDPYNETTNNVYIELASKSTAVLPIHENDYKELVSHINDYNYYMFQLAKIFRAYDEEKANINESEYDSDKDYMKDLLKREDAEYLLEVPFITGMLIEYIKNGGKEGFPSDKKEILKNACEDAFYDL